MYTGYNYKKKNNIYNWIIYVLIIAIFIVIALLISNLNDAGDNEPASKVVVNFDFDVLNIREGDTSRVNVNIINGLPDVAVTYTSSNPSVAIVNQFGIITGIKVGVVEIVATYYDQNGSNVSDSLTVVVDEALDVEKPVIITEYISGSADIWNNSDVSLRVSATDNKQVKSLKYAVNCEIDCIYNDLLTYGNIVINSNGEYKINIVAYDTSDNMQEENLVVKIDKVNPTVSYSVNGGTYLDNQSVVITPTDNVGVKKFSVQVYKNGILVNEKSNVNISESSYTVSLDSDATWKIVTNVEDNAGNNLVQTPNSNGYYQEYVINVNGYYEGPGGEKYSKTIRFKGRTYKIYKQARYPDVPFWGDGTIAANGCGPSSLAIALSGYIPDITPVDTGNVMRYGTFSKMEDALKHFGMSSGGRLYYNSNDRDEDRIKEVAASVRNHLNQGKPLIALVTKATSSKCPDPTKYCSGNHFIAILGEKENGELIIGQSGRGGEGGTLEDLIRYYMPGGRKGFLFINP